MNKKTFATFFSVFVFLYALNYLTPLTFGDDCLYGFIWQGNSMFVPLREDAVRVSSWQDLIVSQWSLYFTWGGRMVGQFLTQFFVWVGKDVFNVINAFVGTIFVAELNWCMNKGKAGMSIQPAMILWIFFVLWAFVPGFSDVFFWLTGACIYLWPALFLLTFLLPFIYKYYIPQRKIERTWIFSVGIFFLGIVAGCGNENSICWIILVLMLFLFSNRKNGNTEKWMFTGIAGLIIGYAILMLAPGNVARIYAGHGSNWLNLEILKHHFSILMIVLLFQAFLWFFSLKSVYKISKEQHSNSSLSLQKDLLLVHTLLVISFGMSATMLLSPEFPIRSGFPGTIPLVIATGILLRVQNENHIELIQYGAKKILGTLSVLFFLVSASVTIYNYYEKQLHVQKILASVDQLKQLPQNQVLRVQPFSPVSFKENLVSGLHIPNYDLDEDESNWKNVAFARYYGIKGICKMKINETQEEAGKEIMKTESAPEKPQSR